MSSACMRARLAARICSLLIVWASDDVVKTTATADMLKNDVQERITEDMVFYSLAPQVWLLPVFVLSSRFTTSATVG